MYSSISSAFCELKFFFRTEAKAWPAAERKRLSMAKKSTLPLLILLAAAVLIQTSKTLANLYDFWGLDYDFGGDDYWNGGTTEYDSNSGTSTAVTPVGTMISATGPLQTRPTTLETERTSGSTTPEMQRTSGFTTPEMQRTSVSATPEMRKASVSATPEMEKTSLPAGLELQEASGWRISPDVDRTIAWPETSDGDTYRTPRLEITTPTQLDLDRPTHAATKLAAGPTPADGARTGRYL